MNSKPSKAERAHLARVKALPCSVCDSQEGSEAHHINQRTAWTCIALCADCHRGPVMGWHGQKRAWAVRKMDELDALSVTIERLMRG